MMYIVICISLRKKIQENPNKIEVAKGRLLGAENTKEIAHRAKKPSNNENSSKKIIKKACLSDCDAVVLNYAIRFVELRDK